MTPPLGLLCTVPNNSKQLFFLLKSFGCRTSILTASIVPSVLSPPSTRTNEPTLSEEGRSIWVLLVTCTVLPLTAQSPVKGEAGNVCTVPKKIANGRGHGTTCVCSTSIFPASIQPAVRVHPWIA